MSTLTDNLQELTDALSAIGEFNVYDHLPEGAVPPAAIILRGSPWIAPGQTFGSRQINWTVWISAPAGTNQDEDKNNFDLTISAVEALTDDGWTVEEVSQPFGFEHENTQLLTTSISISSQIVWQ